MGLNHHCIVFFILPATSEKSENSAVADKLQDEAVFKW